MTEKELTPKVVQWLEGQGYYVAYEVMTCGYCDLVGCQWSVRVAKKIPQLEKSVAVELKISDIKGVLYQATNNLTCCTESYAAMPINFISSMREKSKQRFRDCGVGLLSIGDTVEIIIPSVKKTTTDSNVARRLWNFKLRHSKKT